jgi:hypothetical protein
MTITAVFVTLLIGGFAAIGLAALAYLTLILINSARPPQTEPDQDVMDTEFIESPTVKIVRRQQTVESPTVRIVRRQRTDDGK